MELKDLLRQLLKDQEEIYSIIGQAVEVDEVKRVCRVKPLDGSAEVFDVRLQSRVSSDIGLVVFPAVNSEVTITFLSKDLAYVSQTDEIKSILLNIGATSLLIDNENVETVVKNYKIDADDVNTTAKNVTFTVENLFKLISQNEITLEAVRYFLKAGNIDIEGITKITGATSVLGTVDITGATSITGPVVITGTQILSGLLTVAGGAAIAGGLAVTGGASINGGANGGVPLAGPLVTELNEIKNNMLLIKNAINGWTPIANDGGAAFKVLLTAFAGSALPNTTANEISNPDFTQ